MICRFFGRAPDTGDTKFTAAVTSQFGQHNRRCQVTTPRLMPELPELLEGLAEREGPEATQRGGTQRRLRASIVKRVFSAQSFGVAARVLDRERYARL